MGRHHARAGIIGQTDAGDMAFRHVAARLLAAGQNERRVVSSPWSCCRKVALVGSRRSVRGYNLPRAISWRRCTHLYGSSHYAATVERACLVCEILAARFLAD